MHKYIVCTVVQFYKLLGEPKNVIIYIFDINFRADHSGSKTILEVVKDCLKYSMSWSIRFVIYSVCDRFMLTLQFFWCGNSINSHSVCFALLCTVDEVSLEKEELQT